MTGSAAAAGGPAARISAASYYRDPHETSLTLLLTGAVLSGCEAVQLVWRNAAGLGLVADWPTAFALAIAFGALWLTFHRRAASRGLTRSPGFGIAAVLGLLFLVPPLMVVLVYAGPYVVLGLGLIVAGVRSRNRTLAVWGGAVGAVGVFEGFFGITNRLPYSLWAGWEHQAIYLALGLLTLAAGVVARGIERRKARTGLG